MKYPTLFLSLLLTPMAFAEPLAAIVTFSNTVITAEGVTKQTQFQDLLVRNQHSVWSQRIVPQAAAEDEHPHGDGSHHHHNLNFSVAARWIELDSNNQLRFRLVRAQDKTIIEPRTNEYGTLGFDGVWETAFYQVNRAALQTMTESKKPAAKHALWFERQDEKASIRILWDAKNEIPLVIENATRDGKITSKITFKLVPAPAILPWANLSTYQTIAYEDLLD